jgi:hypothetical protein
MVRKPRTGRAQDPGGAEVAAEPATYIDRIAAAVYAELHDGRPLPPDRRDLYLSYAVLVLVAGDAVELEDVHDAWAAWAARHEPGSPALCPFAELPPEVQARDAPFRDAIRRVATARAGLPRASLIPRRRGAAEVERDG